MILRIRKVLYSSGAALTSGLLTGCAFLCPETLLSAVFGVLSVYFLLRSARADRLRDGFFYGMTLSLLGFYWLPSTITTFGGFPDFVARGLFLLWCAAASLQYVLVFLLARALAKTALRRAALPLPLAWFTLDFVFPQLFPWRPVQTLVAVTPFAGLAEYLGIDLLNVLFLWIVNLLSTGRKILAALLLMLSLGVGFVRNADIAELLRAAPELRVALIQGNLSTQVKGDVSYLEANLDTYRRLSRGAAEKGAQVIFWPESVLNSWTPEAATSVRGERFDPDPASSLPLVYGTLSFRRRDAKETERLHALYAPHLTSDALESLSYMKFNSAFAIAPSGNILGFYHKRVLMPFGEFLPFERSFPVLRAISPHTGEFDVGDMRDPIRVTDDLTAMPLICYEDLVPEMSREGVRRGANLLVNLTNDAWYGKSLAPYQHHLLALWRAVETRRYLLRVTNTGYTAVVDPFGKTVAGLPTFQEGVLSTDVRLLSGVTIAVRFARPVAEFLVLVSVVLALFGVIRARKNSQ